MDIIRALSELAEERPIFSSEADFQHALAWQLHLVDPSAKIRLEHRPRATRIYLDIVVELENKRTAIELKYKTRRLETKVNDEMFWLANHGAQDCGKYDVIKDIERLEQVVDSGQFHEGFMVFLTNDPHYYVSREEEKVTIDREYRLTEGRILNGELRWSELAGTGTTKGREESIRLRGRYHVKWLDYSIVDAPQGTFKMMVVPVMPTAYVAICEPPTLAKQQVDSKETKYEANLIEPSFGEEMVQLSRERPVFKSQYDLQNSLSLFLASQGWSVTTNREFGNGLKTDIWAEMLGQSDVAVEVRYKTSLLTCTLGGESFELKKQSAHDISRYDYWRDVEKLEQIVANRPGTKGYAIMITNEHLYWDKPTKQRSVDEDFLLFDGRNAAGNLQWADQAGFGTVNEREKPIHLSGTYKLKWKDYTNISGHKNGLFRILCISIGGESVGQVK